MCTCFSSTCKCLCVCICVCEMCMYSYVSSLNVCVLKCCVASCAPVHTCHLVTSSGSWGCDVLLVMKGREGEEGGGGTKEEGEYVKRTEEIGEKCCVCVHVCVCFVCRCMCNCVYLKDMMCQG